MSDHVHSPFGSDRFGQAAERFARFFGTPKFILGQTLLVVIWIALNAMAVSLRWTLIPSSCSILRSPPRPRTPHR
jgi:uncharacterized membrane protein